MSRMYDAVKDCIELGHESLQAEISSYQDGDICG